MTNKELEAALDMIDEGNARLIGCGYRDIEERADTISDALDQMWTILAEAKFNASQPRSKPLLSQDDDGEDYR